MTHLLFWDIDGTLLTTTRAGLAAFDVACREVMAIESIDWTGFDMRGFTDRIIARRALEAHDQPADEAAIDRLLACYESHLPAHLAARQASPLPGVVAVLERLRPRADVLSMLLTGNTRRGAHAKLQRCGLLEYFERPPGGSVPFGAFAEDGPLRDSIARAALALAERTVGAPANPARLVVIGDTPHDVSCGKAIGARTVAVATGGYTMDELRACDPSLVWERLPEPDAFESALGLD
jgi:phosphoglycolate phosphatase